MIQPKFPLISCDVADRLQIIDAEEELTRASSLELIAQSKGKSTTYFDADHQTWTLIHKDVRRCEKPVQIQAIQITKYNEKNRTHRRYQLGFNGRLLQSDK